MTFNAVHLDIYRGERAVFDVAPIAIAGGFLNTDSVQFTAKRDLTTADGSAEMSIAGQYVSANIFRITIADTVTLAAGFDTNEIVELYYSIVWTRGSTNEVVLRAGSLWVHPHARSS